MKRTRSGRSIHVGGNSAQDECGARNAFTLIELLVDASASWRSVKVTPSVNRELEALRTNPKTRQAVRLAALGPVVDLAREIPPLKIDCRFPLANSAGRGGEYVLLDPTRR